MKCQLTGIVNHSYQVAHTKDMDSSTDMANYESI